MEPQPNQNSNASCLNCGSSIEGNYCKECGQRTSVHRITFRETIDDFFSSTFALQGPLLSTISQMIKNPGILLRDFISGRRKAYYKPVGYFVVITALYLIIRELIQYDPVEGALPETNNGSPEFIQRFKRAGTFMFANINNIMLFLVFSLGFTQKVFYRKSYNLAEYITIGFFITGTFILFNIIFMLVRAYIFPIYPQISMIILFIYIFYTSRSLHGKKNFGGMIKNFFISFFSILLYAIFGFGFSYLMVG